MNYADLFWRNLRMRFKALIEYRTSLYFMAAGRLSGMVVTLLFWGTIYSFTSDINGWSIGQVVLLQAFYSLFIAIDWFLFDYTDYIDQLTLYGDLDSLITKPINPMAQFMMSKMAFLSIPSFLETAILFFIALQVGATISLTGFIAGFIMTFLAALIITLLLTALGFLSFWIGRTDAFTNIWGILFTINKYPISVYPNIMQLLLTVGIPLAFMQTFPAMAASGTLGGTLIANAIVIELLISVFWLCICVLIWRAGLKRYGSYGG